MERGTEHLNTITSVPDVPWLPVQRRQLFASLDEAARGPLTLLAAPAGYGKTLLLASWVVGSDPPGPVAWVTACPDDRQPAHFWAHVRAALRGAGVPVPEGLAADDGRRLPGDHRFLHSFAAWLRARPDPIVLIVDDLHEVGGTAVPAEIGYLLRHDPSQLRLIVATRADPALPLQRLRMTGHVTEIREATLAFTVSETRELLADQGVRLSDRELRSLWRRTEGWAAGLRLASLSLGHHPHPGRYVDGLTGDNQAIAAYFVEEVLTTLEPELRAFLLRTSMVDRLCGDLADALTGQSNGAEMLARLEREHIFTFRTGPTRSWYRYHRLFGELLRAELRREHPRELVNLHRRAAAWHAANGRPVDAIRHALAGDDVDHAARLVTRTWFSQLIDGRAEQLRTLLTQLPAERVHGTPQLAVVAALSRLALGELHDADAWLAAAAAAEPSFRSLTAPRADRLGLSAARHPDTTAALTLARLLRARLIGDAADASTAAHVLMTGWPDGIWEQHGDADDRRALAFTLLGAAQLWSGRLDDAARHLQQARAVARRTGRDYIELEATAHLALLESLRGSLRRVDELVRSARDQAGRNGWSTGAGVACAELAAAITAYHTDELAVAATALEHATEAAGNDAVILLATAVAGGLLAACRGFEAQGPALERLDAGLRATGGRPPPLLAAAARAARARLLAAAGDDTAAIATLAGRGEPLAAIEVVTLGRLQLTSGDPIAAITTVAALLAGERGESAVLRLPWLIEASLVDAIAHHELSDPAAASRSLRRALELGAMEGYRRAFVEGGTPVQMLLVEHLNRDASHRTVAALLLERLRDAAVPVASAGPTSTAAELPAPLSERELDVLQYLPTTLSAAEIAEELYVSLNTVKTHIKNIYRKLDCNRRWEAVRRARRLQLL